MGTCPEALSTATFGFTNGGLDCSSDVGGYSFYVISRVPTADEIAKICASANCQRVIAAIKAAVPNECTTSAINGFQLYAQILSPIAAGCSGTPAITTPAPTTATPAPTTSVPVPTTAAPAPTTAAPAATTHAPTTAAPLGSSSPSSDGSTPSSSSNTGGSMSGLNTSSSTTGSFAGSSNSGAIDSSSSSTFNTSSNVTVTPQPTATSDASNTANTSPESSGGTSTSLIIGIVAGVVLVVAIVAFVAFRMGRNRHKNRSPGAGTAYSVMEYPNNSAQRHGGGRHAQGTYIQSPVTGTSSSGVGTRSSHSMPSNPKSSDGVGGAGGGEGVIGLWSDRAIQKARIPLEDILMGTVISQGAFGEVQRGSCNGEAVAIKRLLPNRRKDMKEIAGFLEEVKLMTTLRHQRIVRLIGVAWDSLTDLCIVSEFMDGGDLRSFLTHCNENHEPTGFNADKVKIALHIVNALSYLHGLKPPVVHRDLKSRNVLLTRDLDAKLTDFGISRERADATMTAGVGSSMWMAPEVMVGDRYDEKADVFSFGVMLSELDTQQLPYAHATEPGTDRRIPEMALLNMVSAGKLTVAFTEDADPDMVATGRACVQVDPNDRPTASEVLHRMHHIWTNYRAIV